MGARARLLVLDALASGAVTLKALRERTGLSLAYLCETIDDLRHEGLVHREPAQYALALRKTPGCEGLPNVVDNADNLAREGASGDG